MSSRQLRGSRPGSSRVSPVSSMERLVHWILPHLLLALYVNGAGTREYLLENPRALHQELRLSVLNGRSAEKLVEEWRTDLGDESFDTFLAISALERRALRLQDQAFKAWDDGNLKLGSSLLETASNLLQREGSPGEAAFCLYYRAEIYAEQERYLDSLVLLDDALELARVGSPSRHYLVSLLYQSRGYSLWFLDRLRDAMTSFAEAQKHFQKLGYPEGIVISWNNVAVLLEELQILDQAHECYKQAFRQLSDCVDERIQFQLYRNYILFLHKLGYPEEAIRHLETAQKLGGVSPFELLLLKCQVLGAPTFRQRLLEWKTGSPTESIDRLMVLATSERDQPGARRYFREALELSSGRTQTYLRRQVVSEFGRWLESAGEHDEAEAMYRQFLSRRRPAETPEYVFPYSRAESGLFDGWIRCLVRLNRSAEALDQIHRTTLERTRRAWRLIQSPPRKISLDAAHPEQLLTAAGVGKEQEIETSLPPPATFRASGFSVLEFWPDRDRVFVWIDNPGQDHFRETVFPEPVERLIRKALESLYSSEEWLSPPPPQDVLQEIHHHLFEPLEGLLETDSILVIPHKDLQALPIEMLINRNGNYLLERYRFSYLPSNRLPPHRRTTIDRPLIFLPRTSDEEGTREEDFFKSTFPEASLRYGLPGRLPEAGSWIHISSHFLLEKKFWLNSVFEDGKTRLDLQRLLQRPLSCQLLSVGACDLANTYRWAAPYWLGLSELLLNSGVQSLLVSRWKLDELSLSIYENFFERCKAGVPMDKALRLARLDFIRSELQRDGLNTPASHPFFWAGVTYVGLPGLSLYPEPAPPRLVSCLLLLLIPIVVRGLSLIDRGSSGRSRRAGDQPQCR